MPWLVTLDVLLWLAAITLFIFSATIPNFTLFLIGLACVVLAIGILCIMAGKAGALDSVADISFDIFD